MPEHLTDYTDALVALERDLARHPDAEIKNLTRLRVTPHPHTAAMCQALSALLTGFPQSKIVALVEAELAAKGKRSRPEDLVVWIEGLGALVLEIKSHTIGGIRRFENNVPVVVYKGGEQEDVFLVDQPRAFAFELRSEIELTFDKAGLNPPALYWAGWLPHVTPQEVAARRQVVAEDKVWLSDMLNPATLLARLVKMRNLTGSTGTDRNGLALFLDLFGCTAGLRSVRHPRPVQPGTLGYQVDLRSQELRRLTKEQEDLAFSPQLLRGPKVIRGVAGSGKTVVLANAVANLLIETKSQAENDLFGGAAGQVKALVLCYNRALVDYIKSLVKQAFDALKPESRWIYPEAQVEVTNIDRFFYWRYRECQLGEYNPKYGDNKPAIDRFCQIALPHLDLYSHIFIDEGQDIQHDWYPMIRGLAHSDPEVGPSIIIFYDDAQNIYGVRRPGTAGEPSWRELLGADVSRRGLKTVMRVGHRNTNEILSFSFNMLLGAFADRDPQMAGFADLAGYVEEKIPADPQINHPNAGRACVERLGERRFRINFAVRSGALPKIHAFERRAEMIETMAQSIQRLVAKDGEQVDPRDILVMTPNRNSLGQIADSLIRRGLKVHVPIKLYSSASDENPADQPFFQDGMITVSTIKSAKGFSAHICYLAAIEDLGVVTEVDRDHEQKARAEFHVGATRASLLLEVWGQRCPLITEAEQVVAFLSEGQRAAGNCDAASSPSLLFADPPSPLTPPWEGLGVGVDIRRP